MYGAGSKLQVSGVRLGGVGVYFFGGQWVFNLGFRV